MSVFLDGDTIATHAVVGTKDGQETIGIGTYRNGVLTQVTYSLIGKESRLCNVDVLQEDGWVFERATVADTQRLVDPLNTADGRGSGGWNWRHPWTPPGEQEA